MTEFVAEEHQQEVSSSMQKWLSVVKPLDLDQDKEEVSVQEVLPSVGTGSRPSHL